MNEKTSSKMRFTKYDSRFTNDAFKSAIILGLASSGEAAARLLLAEGKSVGIVDENTRDEILRRAASLKQLGAEVEVGVKNLPDRPFDICILSPGVKPSSPVLKAVLARGIPVIPEFELGWSRAKCPVLAVTGSNGKSTFVKLCVEAMERTGLKAFAAGNYGPPVSQVVLDRPDADWLVIEVSSFQLETVNEFHPRVAVLLNVFPNHLDRHHDLRGYFAVKARLFARMSNNDKAIVNEADWQVINESMSGKLPLLSFSLSAEADYFYSLNTVVVRSTGQRINFAGTIFANEVLGMTAAAAVAAMEACGVPLSCLERAAREFQPLPHRMEDIGTRNGVRFIDDSKATNLASMLAALKMVTGCARLIAGGLPKNESYEPACAILAEKVSGVYLIGKAADEMAAAWRNVVPCHLCGTLVKAVEEAWKNAVSGETILLSPACASFDQFRSFEERGNLFRRQFENIDRK